MYLGTQGAPVVALDARRVVEALQLSMTPNPVARDSALKLLKDWQQTHCLGLVPALLDILGGQLGSPREVRLYAAIMTKNLVGCSWDRNVQGWSRALVEKRGWNEMDDAEKEALKRRLLCLLFSEREEQVRDQLVVVVAAIARYELPDGWPSLLGELVDIAKEPAIGFDRKRLALQTLKRVLFALKGKKTILSVTTEDVIGDGAKLRSFMRAGAVEMHSLQSTVKALVLPLYQLWHHWSGVLGRGEEHWSGAGTVANASLSCLRQVVLVLESSAILSADIETFFGEAARQARDLRNPFIEPPPGSPAAAHLAQWQRMAGKSFEVIAKCAIACVDKHPRAFAPHLASFMETYVASVMSVTDEHLARMRQKRLILMTRFLAKILHCQFYKPLPMGLGYALQGQVSKGTEDMRKAARRLGDFFESALFPQFVEALVTRFLILTDEELGEWESDPEGFFLLSNLDLDIESEVRRCCAEALLLFLMERNTEATARVVLSLASQAAQTQGLPSLRLAEACFHALDATAMLMPVGTLNYDAFFATDLVKYLEMPSSDHVAARAMQGRVLHLLVTFSADLSPETYEKALLCALRFLQSLDTVLALYSVKLMHKLCVSDIIGRGPYAEVHSRLLKAQAGSVMEMTFGLTDRLEDTETLQMALRLVAVEVEAWADGAGATDLIHLLANRVPLMWTRILAMSERNTGVGAPCQKSLINILLLLMEKVGNACLSVPGRESLSLREVVFTLIDYCAFNLSADHSVYLLEEGLKLWRTVMLYGSNEALPSQPGSLETLFAILGTGRENHEALCVLKTYVFLCGSAVAREQEPVLNLVVQHCLSDKASPREAHTTLDFLYALALTDAELCLRVASGGVAFLLGKLRSRELAPALLDPLLGLMALLVARDDALIAGLDLETVEELARILLSFHGVRSVHEFLGSAGARAEGRMKRKVAIILLCSLVRKFPNFPGWALYKDVILSFGHFSLQESPITILETLSIRAGLTSEATSPIWAESAFYQRARACLEERDVVYKMGLGEVVREVAEALARTESNTGGLGVEEILGNLGNLGIGGGGGGGGGGAPEEASGRG